MKHFSLGVIALLMSSVSFAITPNLSTKNSENSLKLGKVWKDVHTQVAKLDQNDLLMVYGGKDISLRSMRLNRSIKS